MNKIYLLLISMLSISINLKSFDNKSRAQLGVVASLAGSFYLIKNARNFYKAFKYMSGDTYDLTDERFKKAFEYALFLVPSILLGAVSGKALMNSYLKTKPNKLDNILGNLGKWSSVYFLAMTLFRCYDFASKEFNFLKMSHIEHGLIAVSFKLLRTVSNDLLQRS